MFSSRALGYALLRCTLGLVFLFYGVDKFVFGFLQYARSTQVQFGKTWMPPDGVYAFTAVLPFLEVTVGTLLILGLFTTFSAVLGGLLIVALTTGKTIQGNSQTVSENFVFAIVIFLLLHFIDQNHVSVDALRKRP